MHAHWFALVSLPVGVICVLYARIAQFAILGLVFAMGLRAMGIANEIVQLAFGLVLGAIAVAVAPSLGLSGPEAAGKLLDRWFNRRGDL